jgi:hypothetical protein
MAKRWTCWSRGNGLDLYSGVARFESRVGHCCPDSFPWFSLVPPCKFQNSTPIRAHASLSQFSIQLSFYRPVLFSHDSAKVLLNNRQYSDYFNHICIYICLHYCLFLFQFLFYHFLFWPFLSIFRFFTDNPFQLWVYFFPCSYSVLSLHP